MASSQLACYLSWLERCTGIAEVKGSNPVQAWNFFRLSFRNCISRVITAMIFFTLNSSSRSSNRWHLYIHCFNQSWWPWTTYYDQNLGELQDITLQACLVNTHRMLIIIIMNVKFTSKNDDFWLTRGNFKILKKCLSKSGCHGNVKLNRQGLAYQIVCR